MVGLERYDIGLNITGQIEVHKLDDLQEEIENIIIQIIAHTDLFWAHVDVDYVEPVNKEENIKELNPT